MPITSIKQRYGSRYYYLAMALLIIAGLGLSGLRLFFHEEIKIPGGDSLWQITIEATVPERHKGGKLIITPPLNTRTIRIVSQTLRHPGMNLVRSGETEPGKRHIVLVSRTNKEQTMSIEFNALLKGGREPTESTRSADLTPGQRERYLQLEHYVDPASPEISGIYRAISAGVEIKQELPEKIFLYVNRRLIQSDSATLNNAELALRTGRATTLGRARAMVALCRIANIPARVVSGMVLDESFTAQPHYWVEVYTDNEWNAYDPEKGHIKFLPVNYLPFNRQDMPIVSVESIGGLSTRYRVNRNYELAKLHLAESRHWTKVFDLERFDPDTRRVLAVILLMPFAVLITAVFRNFIGIRAYGTFASTFLALAAVYADWITAAILLAIVIGLGLSGRTMMPDKVQRIPRLGIVFIIVMMSMLFGVSLLDYLHVNPGGHIFLLPLIILTTIVDRFYSAVEQYNLKIALWRLLWTIVIALLCYPIMIQRDIGEWLLGYPELHFITIALLLFVSCYSGPTLIDLPGLRWLKEPPKPKKTGHTNEKRDD